MPTLIRGGYPDIAYFVPDNNNPQNRIPFICRVETDGGVFVNEPMLGLAGRANTAIILRTPVKFEINEGLASIIFEDVYYNVGSIQKLIPDNRTRGFVKSEVFAEYIIITK